MNVQHDPGRIFARLVEETFKYVNDELHRSVIVVQDQYAIKRGLLCLRDPHPDQPPGAVGAADFSVRPPAAPCRSARMERRRLGGDGQGLAPGDDLESRRPAVSASPRAPPHCRPAPAARPCRPASGSCSSRSAWERRSSLKVVSALIALADLGRGSPTRVSQAVGQGVQPQARWAPKRAARSLMLGPGDIADRDDSWSFSSAGGHGRPDARQDLRPAFFARKALASAAPITEKPRGLSSSEAILARNLLGARPIETVRPISASISACSRASIWAGVAPCRRSVPDRSIQASSSDSGWISGVSLSSLPMDAPAGCFVLGEVRLDDHGLRAQLQGLEHRHGRAGAAHAGDVAGGGHHAALAAADDHRLVAQGRVVALLHRGVEGVAVQVGDRQRGPALRGRSCAASRRTDSARPLPRRSTRSRGTGTSSEPQASGGHSQTAPRTPELSP
jgi:hypothetical protein